MIKEMASGGGLAAISDSSYAAMGLAMPRVQEILLLL